jgi:hypothetical protein
LSNASPTYVDVTSYLISASWGNGQRQDLDNPEAGAATFLLKNRHRDFEPGYTAGRFGANIAPMRRFRWTLTSGATTYAQGTWYAREYTVEYPDPGSTYSTTTVECVDGFALLGLATLPSLDPPQAETYSDVIEYDDPFAYYPIAETSGKKLSAATGPDAVVKGGIYPGVASPVLGESSTGILFDETGYARALLDDTSTWHDSQAVTVECVVTRTASFFRAFVLGPYDTAAAAHSFELNESGAWVYTGGTNQLLVSFPSAIGAGTHHLAMTFDGGVIRLYLDGTLVASAQGNGNIIDPDNGEYLYIGGSQHISPASAKDVIAHAAVYDYALSPARIAAHATAALSRGYPQQTAGTRIAAVAANPLWSTAGIPAGQITVTPRMQAGQVKIDAITEAAQSEQPFGLFYFDASGNPAYRAFEHDTTIQAVLGDTPAEVPYDGLSVIYDDALYNQATVTRDGGTAQTVQDTASISAYGGVRGYDATGLPLALDSGARLIAQAIVDGYSQPQIRVESVDLNGSDPRARTQILSREIGDTIRIKRRGEGGTANPDLITRILGQNKTLDVNGDLRCTWTLARGFPATPTVWRIGQSGYSELGVSTILG